MEISKTIHIKQREILQTNAPEKDGNPKKKLKHSNLNLTACNSAILRVTEN